MCRLLVSDGQSLALAIFQLREAGKQSGSSFQESFMSNRLDQVDGFAQELVCFASQLCLTLPFLCLMTSAAHSGQLQLTSPFHPPVISLSFLENEV